MAPPIVQAVRAFVALALDGERPTEGQVAAALDQLVAVCHSTPESAPAVEDETPALADYAELRARLGTRFPGLGLYATAADPLDPASQQVNVGDALDDLANIVADLRAVSWRLDRFGADDAYWHLRFSFDAHWGRHARDLALYLHAKRRA